MWDERYSADAFAYGTTPNEFLVQQFQAMPRGRVLSLAEGEGRNAVFLAKQGYTVTAVDGSAVGLGKAQRLAQQNGVTIECVHADLADFDVGIDAWDGIVSIFCPLPSALRQSLYRQVQTGLKRGGVFLLEAYTPDQLKRDTGGGKVLDVMQSAASLRRELPDLTFIHLLELERSVVEGSFHSGVGAVVQAVARRPA